MPMKKKCMHLMNVDCLMHQGVTHFACVTDQIELCKRILYNNWRNFFIFYGNMICRSERSRKNSIRIAFVIHVIVIHGPIDTIIVDYTLSTLWRSYFSAELMKHSDLPCRFIFIWYRMAILLFTNPTT